MAGFVGIRTGQIAREASLSVVETEMDFAAPATHGFFWCRVSVSTAEQKPASVAE